MFPSLVPSSRSVFPGFRPCECCSVAVVPAPSLSKASLPWSESEPCTVMTAGRSKGTPDGDGGWLPSPGHPMSGLASANTTMLGEEFLDGEEEDWDSLRSIFCFGRGKRGVGESVHLDSTPFYPITTLLRWVVVCQGMLHGIPGVLLRPFLSGGHRVPRYCQLPGTLPI